MIIIMEVAGAGKSVQSQLLAAHGNYQWLSSGVLLRLMISDERRQQMLEGKLLDDSEVIAYWDDALERLGDKPELIVDGFPRTAQQAQWLLEQITDRRFAVNQVIHLIASQEVVKQRLLSRGRADDHDEAIKERFKEYEDAVQPIVELFKQAHIPVYDISADQSVEAVHQAIIKAIDTPTA